MGHLVPFDQARQDTIGGIDKPLARPKIA
jgi:hypothetical protein